MRASTAGASPLTAVRTTTPPLPSCATAATSTGLLDGSGILTTSSMSPRALAAAGGLVCLPRPRRSASDAGRAHTYCAPIVLHVSSPIVSPALSACPCTAARNLVRSATGRTITAPFASTLNSANGLSRARPTSASVATGLPTTLAICASSAAPIAASSGVASSGRIACAACSIWPTARADATMPTTMPSGACAHSAS